MRQYLDAKEQHRDSILLFRMGDFYETFYEDALVASRALEITLTSRSKDSNGGGIPMCGVPYHAVDTYIARLVKKGFRVAICDQVEDPRKAKGLVRREVVRVVSPGTFGDAGFLDAREPAFLMAIAPQDASPSRLVRIGVALLDLSTGEFTAAEYEGPDGAQALADEIAVLKPRELIVPAGSAPVVAADGIPVTSVDAWMFDAESARRTLLTQLRAGGLEGFGLDRHPAAVSAAGALVSHLRNTQKVDLAHVRAIAYRPRTDALLVDPTTLEHLEIIEGADGDRHGSLLDEIDRTMTSIGSRLMRSWLLRPLITLEPIRDRLDAVEELAFLTTDRGKFRDAIKGVQDLERLLARAALGTAGPRDLVGLRQSLTVIPRVRAVLSALRAPLVQSLLAELDDLADVRDDIERTLVDEPPALARDGGFTREGRDPEIDELRRISRSGKQVIAEMEERERARTGISSLKVRFNRVFGYYIEISKSNLHAVPPDYHRKQTVAGGERFITPALKEYEEKVLGADERIVERELEVLDTLRRAVAAEAPRIQASARALATLDVLAALAEVASVNNYIKPHVHDGDELTVARRPASRGRAPRALVGILRRLRAERRDARRPVEPARHPDRAQHGRQVHVPQAGGAAVHHGAGRVVRARPRGQDPARRPHLRPRRRVRQHRAGPVHVHGRDAGDREHPARRHIEKPGRPRRDWPRHRDLRRLEHRLGRRRIPGDQSPDAPEDPLRHALPRAHRPGGRDAGRRQLSRRRARVEGRHHLPAEDRSRTRRSQLRHPGGAAGGPPGRPSSTARVRFCRRSSATSSRAAGRPSLSGTPSGPQQQLGLFQPPPADDRLRAALEAVDVDRITPLEALSLLADLKKQL